MIQASLFADQKREVKLSKLGDALQVIKHMSTRRPCYGCRPCGTARQARARRPSAVPHRTDGARAADPAAIQLERWADGISAAHPLEFPALRLVTREQSDLERDDDLTFKKRLLQAGASESVFDAINRQLSQHGYIARGGQLLDASIVQALMQ
jgi:IS5 family transposase